MDITKAPTVLSEELQADNLKSPVGGKSACGGIESTHGSTQAEGQVLSKLKSENPLPYCKSKMRGQNPQ